MSKGVAVSCLGAGVLADGSRWQVSYFVFRSGNNYPVDQTSDYTRELGERVIQGDYETLKRKHEQFQREPIT
ncbi:MAG: hypothetical protein MK188_13800 [Gammaproteobacteria bacterium]|nr:hypothetical protein [Gammaproteobacteria bacterium]